LLVTAVLAVEATRTLVVEHGSDTSWWIPLVVAAVAALASYYATWRFKKMDVNRENAIRAADLVDEAEQLVSASDRFQPEPESAENVALGLLHRARVRAEPLADRGLDDRFRAAFSVITGLVIMQREPPEDTRYWLREAISNVRAALVPHLSTPTFFGRRAPTVRSFPTALEFDRMAAESGSAEEVIDSLPSGVRTAWSTTPRRAARPLADGGYGS
jgi:hypothetical protein